MNDSVSNMKLDMPVAWENFGQWLVYAIILGMVIAVLIFMFRMIFPKNESEESEDNK